MTRITRYEPIHVLNDINKLFEQTFFPQYKNEPDYSNLETSQWTPAVDIKEGKEGFKLKVDLPGIDKKNIDISMDNGVLSIQGERADEIKEEGDNYYRVERVSGKFYRRFALPETADADRVQANMAKGVLEITIPKKEIAQPKAIQIDGDE